MKIKKSGFTLLELLIVVGILAIMAVALVVVINPAETLKKSRDSQRLSDLSSIKTALSFYLANTTTPYLGGNTDNSACRASSSVAWAGGDKIFYSYLGNITDTAIDGGSISSPAAAVVTAANVGKTDSNGWIPVNLNSLSNGSPISNFPIDPINTINNTADVAATDLVYRYACEASPVAFEVDAELESNSFTVADDKRAKDGGNNSNLYETGTDLWILGTGTDF